MCESVNHRYITVSAVAVISYYCSANSIAHKAEYLSVACALNV